MLKELIKQIRAEYWIMKAKKVIKEVNKNGR